MKNIFYDLHEVRGDTPLGLTGACLVYLLTLGLGFLLDSLSQLTSVMA